MRRNRCRYRLMPKEHIIRLLERAAVVGFKLDDLDLQQTVGDLETKVRHRERENAMRSLHADVNAGA